MASTKLVRAYIKLVKNKKARTNASKHYFQVFAENTNAYLFTTADMEKARNRAIKNPEDVYPVEFTEPEPEIIVKEVIKYVEVYTPGFFRRILNKITGK
jgi:hypothetical protein